MARDPPKAMPASPISSRSPRGSPSLVRGTSGLAYQPQSIPVSRADIHVSDGQYTVLVLACIGLDGIVSCMHCMCVRGFVYHPPLFISFSLDSSLLLFVSVLLFCLLLILIAFVALIRVVGASRKVAP